MCEGGKGEGVSAVGRAGWLCNPWWRGMGDTRALFPALLCVFLATLGKLLLLMQPGVFKDALKSPDKALQMFSSLADLSVIQLVGK